MDSFSSEFLSLLTFLIPGFITAWVVFGLTAAKKPTQFERVIQALIFTAVLNATLDVVAGLVSETCSAHLGEYRLAYLVVFGLLLGVGYSLLINKDFIHKGFRAIGLTQRSALSNEWNLAHAKLTRNWIVLHMKDGQRLMGFPEACPTTGEDGHYFITYPQWINSDGTVEIDLSNQLEGMLIPVKEISRVEFCKAIEANDEKHQDSN